MTTLQTIETAARTYAAARLRLAETVSALQAQLDASKFAALPEIRAAALSSARTYTALHELINANHALFDKPKTRLLHGIKCGLRKQPGAVEIDNEEKTIARIRALLPKAQADLLIRVRECVDKEAVGDLIVDDLKRLGVRVTDDTDVVVIKATGDDIDKLVTALVGKPDIREAAA